MSMSPSMTQPAPIHPSQIRIADYHYDLPEERIAKFPLPERDQSKLLIFQNQQISEDIYHHIDSYIPAKSLMIFNQAKVIHARLYFHKQTGGKIEIFCLEPDERYSDITTAMKQENTVYWKCLIRGAYKWKEPVIYGIVQEMRPDGSSCIIHADAQKISQQGNTFIIQFRWWGDSGAPISFSEFLECAGKIPIPPYLKREATSTDEIRYQTIFAQREGSVAAPTASLHFTDYILNRFKEKDIAMAQLTLHVGAGTFMPVKSSKMEGHEMHAEWIELSVQTLKKVKAQIARQEKIVCIGTTSARSLESAYWIGVQILRGEWTDEKLHPIAVTQWLPYQQENTETASEAIQAVIDHLEQKQMEQLITRTKLIIAPGYTFKILDGLVTNFHQPASTLLLMIAALIGDSWKKVYQYALDHDFRFLSYGDGSLLWKK